MRLIQIEAWTLAIIDRVNSKSPIEDFRVELKSEWPQPQKAARQIAGHANAARGESILWLIGVDEDKGVTGATHEELANWFVSIQAEFDGIAPSMIDINIPIDGKTIVALYFETDQAPYVVKNPSFGKEKGGPISHETPWREGTSTRSARHSDLIKILIPIVNLPEIDILWGELVLKADQQKNWFWELSIGAYITPQTGYPCVLPFHQCKAFFEITNHLEQSSFDSILLAPPYKQKFGGSTIWDREPDSRINFEKTTAKIRIKIRPSNSERTMEIKETLHWQSPPDNELISGRWNLLKTST